MRFKTIISKGGNVSIRIRRVTGSPMLVVGGRKYWYLRQVVGTILLIPAIVAGWILFQSFWWEGIKLGGIILRTIVCITGLYAINLIVNPEKRKEEE